MAKARTTILLAVLLSILLTLAEPSPKSLAHEAKTVRVDSSEYKVTAGWMKEPVYVDELNGALVDVAKGGQPVLGLEETLKLEVTTGQKSRSFSLKPLFNPPGRYVAEFIPTVPGSYNFRLFGTIDGKAVEILFRAGEAGLEGVTTRWDLHFPEKIPTGREVSSQLESLDNRVETVLAQQAAVQGSFLITALLAAVATVLGVASLVVSLWKGRRKQG